MTRWNLKRLIIAFAHWWVYLKSYTFSLRCYDRTTWFSEQWALFDCGWWRLTSIDFDFVYSTQQHVAISMLVTQLVSTPWTVDILLRCDIISVLTGNQQHDTMINKDMF